MKRVTPGEMIIAGAAFIALATRNCYAGFCISSLGHDILK